MATFRTRNSSSGSNILTLSPTAGDTIITFVDSGGGGGAGTFSDNIGSGGGEPWVTAKDADSQAGDKFYIGYLLNCPAGITTLTATIAGGPGINFFAAIAYQPAAPASFVGVTAANSQTNPGTATDAIVSAALACGSTPALLVGLGRSGNGNYTEVAGTGFTLRTGGTADWVVMADSTADVTGAQTAKFTDATNGGADTFLTYAIAFVDAAAAAALHTLPLTGAGR